MNNKYHESERIKAAVLTSDEYLGRRVFVQFPSGNGSTIRVHGTHKGKLRGCSTSWDNLATELYDLTRCFVELEPEDKDDRRWKINLTRRKK